MDKEPPAQLNADWYRRRNHNTIEGARQQPVGGSGSSVSMASPTPTPNMGASPPGGGSAPPPPPPTNPPRPPHGPAQRFVRSAFSGSMKFAGKALRIGGTVVLLATAVAAAGHYVESAQVDAFFGAADDDKDKQSTKAGAGRKKRVLVLPFDNLKVVERRKGGGFQDLQPLLEGGSGSKQPTITIEAKELVEAIHAAANDPNISALYADFGEGMRHPMGYAHIEEIRNAIRIFNESHRVHREPNVNHDPVFAMMRNGNPKPSYAFGHSFQWNEYFLASAFSYVHLQARGNLHLFGTAASNVFLRGMLDKYGIKAHVFRHGEYKNAASIFMDKKYSRSHLETVKSMTASLNDTICTCIENSRALNFDSVMWQSIFDYGSLTAANSAEIGLVDATPPVDAMLSLLDINKRKVRANKKKSEGDSEAEDGGPAADATDVSETLNKQYVKEHFGLNESFGKFTATEAVPLVKYRQMLNKRANLERRRREIKAQLQPLAEKSTATSAILGAFGFQPDARRDKVVVVTVDGDIKSSLSYEVVRALRQVREDKDVKAMVLRVNSPGGSVTSSEAMLEEIKLFRKPVICSMSNAAASGGYYIAMNSEKIFAQPTTLTGSIGVFGIKFDASKWADGYGIHSDRYPRDSHATSIGPLTPLTPKAKDNIARSVLDIYDYFKSVVASGRSLPVEEVEKVAQGRVWTGEQAKEVGLVDALGGLDRAISYARTSHTTTDDVAVEYYPKRSSPLEALPNQLAQGSSIGHALLAIATGSDDDTEAISVERIFGEMSELKFGERPHYMMTSDEQTALNIILSGE